MFSLCLKAHWFTQSCYFALRLDFHIMEDKKPTEEPSHANPKDSGTKDTPSSEEQMSAYEEELKNTDWGHQPC